MSNFEPKVGKLYRILSERTLFKDKNRSVMLIEKPVVINSIVLVSWIERFHPNPLYPVCDYFLAQIVNGEDIGFIWVGQDWKVYMSPCGE